MAEKLKEFPGGPTRGKYRWDLWLDGSAWLLRKGDDYEISSLSMRAVASRAAKAAGKKVRTRLRKDPDGSEALIIQAYE
jgi:hypothetical protein